MPGTAFSAGVGALERGEARLDAPRGGLGVSFGPGERAEAPDRGREILQALRLLLVDRDTELRDFPALRGVAARRPCDHDVRMNPHQPLEIDRDGISNARHSPGI